MYIIDSEYRERGKLEIKFSVYADEEYDPFDNDCFGEFSAHAKDETSINRYPPNTRLAGTFQPARYYTPSQSVAELRKYYQKAGESRGVAEMKAREAIRAELEQAEEYLSGDRQGVGVEVIITYDGMDLGESALWGIDVPSYWTPAATEEYIWEMLSEAAYLAMGHAEGLDSDKYTKEFIDKAVKRLTRLQSAVDRLVEQRRKAATRRAFQQKISAWRKGWN